MIAGLLGLLLAAPAHASDPWGRPAHLRAVQQPPSTWADLDRRRQPVRLWWDREGAQAEVQVRRGRSWETVARDAAPGWTSRPLPRGSLFRVRLWQDGEPARWSQPVQAPAWSSPSDLARLGAAAGAQLASRTGQVRGGHRQGIWASTLGGGAVEVDPITLQARRWTRWEGLPDDRVIDLALDGERVLLGTAAGALLLDGGLPARSWREELPSAWVQAVALEGGRAWLGTDAGLVLADQAQAVLEPDAVFSLAPAEGGGVWAAYAGVVRVDEAGQVAREPTGELLRRLPGEHVYDLQESRGQLWAASEETGLHSLDLDPAGPVLASQPPAAYALAPDPQEDSGLWVARGERGLHWSPGTWLGRDDGLPSDSVWAVETLGDRVWLGTDAGVAALVPDTGLTVQRVPQAPWPADRAASALLLQGEGAWIAGEAGMSRLGRPHPQADDLVVAAPHPVEALIPGEDGDTWAVGSAAVRLDRRGGLHRVELPVPATDAAWWQGALWIVQGERLWRIDPQTGAGRTRLVMPGLTRVIAGADALWVIAGGRVLRVGAEGAPRPYVALRLARDLALDGTQLWVGTLAGLQRLLPGEGTVEEPLGEQDDAWRIEAVAADGSGGCWLATEDARVGHLRADGSLSTVLLAEQDPPRPRRIVVEEDGGVAWVLTDAGTWRVVQP